MPDVKTLESKPNSNGSWSDVPVYPRISPAKTIRHVASADKVLTWLALSLIAIGLAVVIYKADAIYHQLATIRSHLSISDADRHQLHREIEASQ
jgi:hypothetical protein